MSYTIGNMGGMQREMLLAQVLGGQMGGGATEQTMNDGQPIPFEALAPAQGQSPLGGPLQSAPVTPTTTDLILRGGYTNMYGTDIGGSFNPTTGRVEADATFPIGDYRNGYYAGGNVFYTPGGDRGAGIKFGRNRPDGGNKFGFDFGVEQRRRNPAAGTLGVPAGLIPGTQTGVPGLFPGAQPPNPMVGR